MSISAVSSCSSTVMYSYFKSAISTSQLETLLKKYGLKSTGDTEQDMKALYQVMSQSAVKEVVGVEVTEKVEKKENKQSVEGAASTENQIPWANLMSQVGLFTSGDLNTDYISFMNQVSLMKASAGASTQQKANIEQLMAQAGVVFAQQNQPMQANQSTASSSDDSASKQQSSGADILAKLNKMRMLG